jgi:hypothetical protein
VKFTRRRYQLGSLFSGKNEKLPHSSGFFAGVRILQKAESTERRLLARSSNSPPEQPRSERPNRSVSLQLRVILRYRQVSGI